MKTLGIAASLSASLMLMALSVQPALAQNAHGGGGGGHAFAGHAGASSHFGAAPHFGGSHAYGGFHGGYGGYGGVHAGLGFAPGRSVAAAGARFGGGLNRAAIGVGRFGPGAGWRYGAWRGGYWGGRFWPGVYWGGGFAWFLPVLPAYYATYWWGGVPYYYYNDVYYTWDAADNGYSVTNPPPVADASTGDASAPPSSYSPPDSGQTGNGAPPSGDNLFAYPKNGQSTEQQATDRTECDQWASSQAGNDSASAASMDHRRAMSACLQGRGYSVN